MKNDKSKLKNNKDRKKGSLQTIEDFYLNLDYHGDNLRKTLLKDREYQELLKQKKAALDTRTNVSLVDKKKYVLSTDADFEILDRCKKLEKLALTKDDRLLVKIIKSQLELDWRGPLLEVLNKVSKKY